MTENTALSRGDRNRDKGLAGLRVLVPAENASVGIDLADRKRFEPPRWFRRWLRWAGCD